MLKKHSTSGALASDDPARYGHQMLNALSTSFQLLKVTDRPEDAVACSGEAIELSRYLATSEPDDVRVGLTWWLHEHGQLMLELDQPDEAHRAFAEALTVLRPLASQNPDEYRFPLAKALSIAGYSLNLVHRWDESQPLCAEAVEILRPHARDGDFTLYGPYLQDALMWVSGASNKMSGPTDASMAYTQELVEVSRRLAETDPGSFQPALATALDVHGAGLLLLEQVAEARWTFTEAIQIWRSLVDQDPGKYSADLASAVGSLGAVYLSQESRDEARSHYIEAFNILSPLADADPGRYGSDMAANLHDLAATYDPSSSEGLDYISRATDWYRANLERDPSDENVVDLCFALRDLADAQRLNGHPLKARRAEKEQLRVSLEHPEAVGWEPPE